jgi:hypothetical protein
MANGLSVDPRARSPLRMHGRAPANLPCRDEIFRQEAHSELLTRGSARHGRLLSRVQKVPYTAKTNPAKSSVSLSRVAEDVDPSHPLKFDRAPTADFSHVTHFLARLAKAGELLIDPSSPAAIRSTIRQGMQNLDRPVPARHHGGPVTMPGAIRRPHLPWGVAGADDRTGGATRCNSDRSASRRSTSA